MNYGRVEGPSSSRSRFQSTARFAAISAIRTAILSRSDRPQTSHTVNACQMVLFLETSESGGSTVEGNWSRQWTAYKSKQKSYRDAPREGITIAHFLNRRRPRTIGSLLRKGLRRSHSEHGGRQRATIPSACKYLDDFERWRRADSGQADVTLSVPDPNHINSFLNFRVADIQACYELWRVRTPSSLQSRFPSTARFRCYIRDPDGYIIEVGQSTDLTYG